MLTYTFFKIKMYSIYTFIKIKTSLPYTFIKIKMRLAYTFIKIINLVFIVIKGIRGFYSAQ